MEISSEQRLVLERYSRSELSGVEARRALADPVLGDITFGELLILLANAGLRLPRAPTAGREADIARAQAWMFPKDVDDAA